MPADHIACRTQRMNCFYKIIKEMPDMTNPIKPFCSIVLLAVALTGCGGEKAAGTGGMQGGMPPPEVNVVTVGTGNAILTRDLPGRLQAYRTAQVRARVDGVIEKRLFREGSNVKAGDPLYRIDAPTYRAAAASAKADLAIAQQNVERYKSLLEIKAVSQLDYDLAAAKAKQAEAALSQAEEDLGNARVPAAISGRIGRSLVTEGALVSKGEATLLATIEQLDPIYANFTQSGSDLLRMKKAIKAGKFKHADSAKVELVLEDGSVYPQNGRIFFTDMAVDPDTGSVSLRAVFPNHKHELLPGMFVRVRFPEALAENVIRVPQRAVQAGQQGQFVMVVGADSKAMPVPVKTGGMTGTDFIISEGLKGGEQVIVDGLQKARPGTPVKPVSLDAPSGEAPSGDAQPAAAANNKQG
jgi:membrane fusion protein (multidrug efflux system)